MKGQHPAQTAAALVISIGLLVLLLFIAIVSVAANYFGMAPDLPMHVVGGAIALLAAVAFTGVALSFFGLSDKTQALGLPDGSVRAIIALLLIVVFAIMGVHFFDQINAGVKNQVNVDLAKQLVTILGTLVASISSFYFGSAAVASATAAAGAQAPAITGISPTTAAAGTTVTATITGTNLLQVDKARLSRGGSTIGGTNVLSNATSISCTFAIDATAELGAWDVTVETPDKKSSTLPGAFTITAASTAPPPAVPTLSAIDPTTGARGSTNPLTATGTNLQLVTGMQLKNNGTTIPATDVTSNATSVKGTLLLPTDAALGKWTVEALTSDNQTATLPAAFEITKST